MIKPLAIAATIAIGLWAAPVWANGPQSTFKTAECSPGSATCTTYSGEDPAPHQTVFTSRLPALAASAFATAVGSAVTPDGLSNRTLSGSGTASLWDGNGTLFVDGPGPNDKFTNTLGDCDPFTNLCNGRFNTTGATSSTTAENKVSGDWWEAVTEFEIRIKQGFGVGAFGFYGTDIGDFAGSLSISLFERDDQSEDEATKVTVFPQQSGLGDSGSLLFFGVVDRDRLFTKIRFNIRQSSDQLDSLGFDDLVFGNLREIPTEPEPMPLPGTAALALLGIGLLAGTRARRRG